MSETQFTKEFIRDERKIAERATPRPWIHQSMFPSRVTDTNGETIKATFDNHAYTTIAANHYPAAIAEIERLQRENAELRERAEQAELALAHTVNVLATAIDVLLSADDGHSDACGRLYGGECTCWQAKREEAIALTGSHNPPAEE